MLDRIPQKDTEIIEQLALNYAESVREAARNTLATMYKKGVIAERKALIEKVFEIIDDWKMEGVETITMNGSAYEHHVETLKKMVADLKGGAE